MTLDRNPEPGRADDDLRRRAEAKARSVREQQRPVDRIGLPHPWVYAQRAVAAYTAAAASSTIRAPGRWVEEHVHRTIMLDDLLDPDDPFACDAVTEYAIERANAIVRRRADRDGLVDPGIEDYLAALGLDALTKRLRRDRMQPQGERLRHRASYFDRCVHNALERLIRDAVDRRRAAGGFLRRVSSEALEGKAAPIDPMLTDMESRDVFSTIDELVRPPDFRPEAIDAWQRFRAAALAGRPIDWGDIPPATGRKRLEKLWEQLLPLLEDWR